MDSQDITDIVLSVATSVFRDVCLLRLSWHVQEFAILLKPVAKGMFSSLIIGVVQFLNLNPNRSSSWTTPLDIWDQWLSCVLPHTPYAFLGYHAAEPAT